MRAKIQGTSQRPRISVFRSNRHLYAQLIDDASGKIMAAVSDLKPGKKKKASGTELARLLGKALAEKAASKGVSKAVFDRGGYKYHGKVKAVAEGAREAGLSF